MGTTGRRIGAIVSMLAILGFGVAIGIVVERLWLSAPPTRADEPDEARVQRLTERFRSRLRLSPEQARVIGDTLRRSRAELNAIRQRIDPELRAVRARSRADISATLNEKQREKYERMIREYEARRAKTR